MTTEYATTDLLLQHLSFSQGKWQGSFQFIISNGEEELIGSVPFTYGRTFNLHAFQYPKLLDEKNREKAKEGFYEKFTVLAKELEKTYFKPRTKHFPRPVIESFEINEEMSDLTHIFATFKLRRIRDTFFLNTGLIDDEWTYKIHSKDHHIDTYKDFYEWEDIVFEKAIEEIHKHTKFRMKFVLHSKKFKYK